MNVLGIAMVALTLQNADTTAPALAVESSYTIHSTGVELGATLRNQIDAGTGRSTSPPLPVESHRSCYPGHRGAPGSAVG